jgi:hypothetical protein
MKPAACLCRLAVAHLDHVLASGNRQRRRRRRRAIDADREVADGTRIDHDRTRRREVAAPAHAERLSHFTLETEIETEVVEEMNGELTLLE